MRVAESIGVNTVPLKVPGKYCVMEPPSGAPGLMLMARRYIDPVEAKLEDSKGSATEALVSMGIETRFGHSYCRPSSPWWLKLEACVQFLRLGEV